MRDDFVVFILTHGRPDNVKTYKTLKRQGYTGKIVFVLDNEDETAEIYFENFPDDDFVIVDKRELSKKYDSGDLGHDRRIVLYARNACFDIARDLGYRYFLQLDDDYICFRRRYEKDGRLLTAKPCNLDPLFSYMIDFLNESGALTVAFAQSGDFVGGVQNDFWRKKIRRKAMNTFFCDVEKPFQFMGSINEDVNMYTLLGNRGELILSIADMTVEQTPTQANAGGLTDIYLDKGTYLKSFYSVMYSPQCVKVADFGPSHRRLHHRVSWNNCTPLILSDKWKKAQ